MNTLTTQRASSPMPKNYALLEPTIWGTQPPSEPIRLHANEMPFDLPMALKQQLAGQLATLAWNRYPDMHNRELTKLLAERLEVKPDRLVLGNGSAQLIQQIVSCFAPLVSVAVLERPTFSFYHQVCANAGLPYLEWALADNGSFDLQAFPELEEPALVMLSSPNNPTGSVLPTEMLEGLLQQHPASIFVLDEAYGEFTDHTLVNLTHDYPNLLVLKSFSKGYGLAALRLGYVAGGPSIIDMLKKQSAPFAINSFSELLATAVLTDPAVEQALRLNRERVKGIRDFTRQLLTELSQDDTFTVYPSQGNFLLLRFHDPALFSRVTNALQQRNILVAHPLPQTIRLSIGTEPEMLQFVRLIRYSL